MRLYRIVRRKSGTDHEYLWNGGQVFLVEKIAVEARDRLQRVNDMYASEVEQFPSHEYQVEQTVSLAWEVLFDSDWDYPESEGLWDYPEAAA